MQYPHPLSRKLFFVLMGLHFVGGLLYFIPGFAGEDIPVSLAASFGATYILLAALTLYGFVKKLSWAWMPIVAIFMLGIAEAFVLKNYQTDPNIPFDLYVETFSATVILSLYGRAVRTLKPISPKKVGLLKRDIWHWLMVFFVPVIGEFVSLYILGRDNVYTSTKGRKKLYIPSSRAVLVAISALICFRFVIFSIRLV